MAIARFVRAAVRGARTRPNKQNGGQPGIFKVVANIPGSARRSGRDRWRLPLRILFTGDRHLQDTVALMRACTAGQKTSILFVSATALGLGSPLLAIAGEVIE
jgi:hypothetical protein